MNLPPRVRGTSIASDTPFAYDFAAIVRQRGMQLFAYSREGKLLAKGVAGQDDANVLSAAMDELTKGRSWYERLVIAAHLKLTKFPAIEQDYTIIDCQGVLERSSPQNDEFITIRNCNNVIWRGGEIFEPYAVNSPSLGLMYVNNVNGIVISDVYAHDGNNANIYLRNSNNIIIRSCRADASALASGASDDTGGIVVKSGDAIIEGCLVSGGTSQRGILAGGNAVIASCHVRGLAESDGVHLVGTSGTILGCVIRNNGYNGVVVDANQNIVLSNRITANTLGGVVSGTNTSAVSLIAFNDFTGQASPVQIATGSAIVRHNRGYRTENGGKATFSGDGTATQFAIAHGLAKAPGHVVVTPGSADALGDYYITADSSNIYVNYAAAPPAGTNNVVLFWHAEV